MRGITLSGSRLSFRDDLPEPEPAAGEVSVRVTRAGICETDLQLVKGYMGFHGVLGHEFTGVAESGQYAGRRVVGEINCPCGHCETCRSGLTRHCPHRTVIGILNHDGAFAEQLTIPEICLHAIPDHVPDEFAVFTEPVAAACRILEQELISPASDVLILGAGRLGNLCAQVLQTHCHSLQVIGKHDWKLTRIADCGISAETLDTFHPAPQWDVVVDCTGSPSGLPVAFQCVRPCGTIVLKTTTAAEQSLQMASIVIDETRIVGSRCGPFVPALRLIADGKLQLAPLISATYNLEQSEEAFAMSARSDVLKVQFLTSRNGKAPRCR